MKRLELPPYKSGPYIVRDWNKKKDEVLETIAPAVNQHAETIEDLIDENKKMKEQIKTLEKIIEVLQTQIDEIKQGQQDGELVAQIQQQPPKYYESNK